MVKASYLSLARLLARTVNLMEVSVVFPRHAETRQGSTVVQLHAVALSFLNLPVTRAQHVLPTIPIAVLQKHAEIEQVWALGAKVVKL